MSGAHRLRPSSAATESDGYTCSIAVRMYSGCTATERFRVASNQYEPEIEWMLPSKIKPTISPAALTTGLPELPPTMSLVVEKLARAFRSSLGLASIQRCGRAKGATPVLRSNRRVKRVNGSTGAPRSSQPSTAPYDTRSVDVASG